MITICKACFPASLSKPGLLFTAFLTFLLMMNTSCKSRQNVDLILYNAHIYSVDEDFSQAEAFAVQAGKFVAVGSREEILSSYQSDNKIDAKGKFVYPGFYDAHCHFYGYGSNLLKRADLAGTPSPEDVILRLKKHRELNPSGWLEGRGWDQNDWPAKDFPDKHLLDEAFPDIPVYLIRIDGHAAWVNSKALELAGITSSTIVQGGSVVLKDKEPSGILIDEAMELVASIIPPADETFIQKALLMAQEKCLANGLTSLADAGLPKKTILLIDSMQQADILKIRIYAMLDPSEENILQFMQKGPYVTDKLSVRSVKLYADGALGSRGACLLKDYADDAGNRGILIKPENEYRRICQLAYDNGYQVNTHAIGDSANRFILGIYADFLKGDNDLRWRIEHAQVVHPDDMKLFTENRIIPSVQPTHATSDMYWAEARLGAGRMAEAYAYQTLLQTNEWLPLGTDFPIEQVNPLLTFYAAVARQDVHGFPEGGFQPGEALSREQALRGMTLWAAKAAFEENVKGSIEVGKWADFVILEKDIMGIPILEVPGVQLISTWISGLEVYQANNSN